MNIDWLLTWQFLEIGKEENLTEPDDGVNYCLKSAQYCEECKRFIGRWITWMGYKVWCKDCINGKENKV